MCAAGKDSALCLANEFSVTGSDNNLLKASRACSRNRKYTVVVLLAIKPLVTGRVHNDPLIVMKLIVIKEN